MSMCYVHGVSVFGPGLTLWPAARPVLRGDAKPTAGLAPPPAPALLAPNERRRAGLPVRLALAVCEEAVAMSGLAPGALAGVFASANGEGAVVHGLLETLAGPDRLLSPTQFHNSVHNAVAGYWSIGTRSMQPVTCVACHDWSFAGGLLQAVASCRAGPRPVLFCAYDAPIPAPLGGGRRTDFAFATAFVLSPDAGPGALAKIHLRMDADPEAAQDGLPRHDGLRAWVAGNAAARALRLLETLALEQADAFSLALPDGRLGIDVIPC
jgi:hypothetical protein